MFQIGHKNEKNPKMLTNFQKYWKFKIGKKLKNEVLKIFDFSKSEKFPPCLVPVENKGGISHRIELIRLVTLELD